ncbi:probable disease resistance protein At4g27220 [Pistacia vera]|uniref:probable disease resistance protein At4g27220 n=1 Tax=Pistacia vera TaxID=55513 RepID=UPI001263D0C4|nr:probable disease resistance protein At4g27220 [Pistacia vera]
MAQEIAVAIGADVVKGATSDIYGLLKQQISYVFKYQNYINDLKKQVQELISKRQMVQKPVESAERQGEEIYELVTTWLSDVHKFTEGVAKSIIEDEDKANMGVCFKLVSCPNLIQRYRLGKKAMKATVDGVNLLGKGNFSHFSYRPALPRTELHVRGYEAFDSRKQVLQEIMDTLKEANVDMIGVYGMGGVGKTTLVRKVASLAKENKLFDKVVVAEVTQTPDNKKIQEKIAFDLGLEFMQESEYQRGDLIRSRINKKNVLIILDDIWTKIDLDAIGIPKDDKIRRCTVLLTSRNLDVLRKDMKTQKSISVHPLSDGDAWNLFRKIVGDSAENPDFNLVAVQIVTKCAGLPIAISTIASALKYESLNAWEDTLAQLKRSNPRCILDMSETLYSTIEQSYKFLQNEEAKKLFLLCALKDAGSGTLIEYLLRYSMGWSLFGDGYTLEEGRNRLHRLIDHLKARCLLLDDGDDSVKMHDIIHAIAVSIASTDNFMFNIQNVTGLKEVLEKKKDSTAISLPYRDIFDELPEKLECPKLQLFFLFIKNQNLQIPDTFFEGMRELKVLNLTGIQFLSLPSSLDCLKKIRTLCLNFCLVGDVAIVGKLKTLEILSFVGSDIEQLPGEIRQLTRLKLLDLSYCLNLRQIAPNVISYLSQLEELYMGDSFVQWEVEGVDNQGRRNASLGELKRLSNLTALHLYIQDAGVMPQDLFFKKLKSYKIFIGDKWKWSGKYDLSTSRTFKLKINNRIYLGPGIKTLLKMTEDLSLEEMNGVRNVLYELDMDGFPHLKHLLVKDGLKLLYVIKSIARKLAFPKLESLILCNLINLEKICHGQLNAGSFSELRIMKIENCDRLVYLFASSVAKNLIQLREIEVKDCKNLKEIFGEESKDHCGEDILGLNNLKSLKVYNCRSLRYIFTPIIWGLDQLQEIEVKNCGLIEEIITKDKEKKATIDKIIIPHLKSIVLEILPNLTNFYSGTNDLECPSLKSITIANCPKMETFVFKDLKEKDHSDYTSPLFSEKVAFPSLEVMVLLHLDNLQLIWHPQQLHMKSFCKLKEVRVEFCEKLKTIVPSNSHGLLTFYNLEKLTVENCWSMKSLFPITVATGLMQLNDLYLFSCGLEKIVSEEEVNGAPRFLFPQLTYIYLSYLPELKSFYSGLHTTEWPMLNTLAVYGCKKIKIYASEFACFEKEDDGESQPALFPLEKVMPNLEGLGLDAHDFRLTFLHSDLAENFCKLKTLSVSNFDDESVASLFDFLQRLNCLEQLGFFDNNFKELFPYEQGCMWKQDTQVDTFLQNLQILDVERCHYLTILMPSVTAFKNIKTLEAFCCNGLVNVLTCSAVKTLVNLTTLRIRDCNLVTEVIANEGDREEEIVFGQLKLLELYCLSSLTFFCSANYSFKFPCLEQVIVSQCPKLEIFCQGMLSTPMLKKVQLTKQDDGREYFWKEDLNSTIQQMFIDMVGFRNFKQ